MLKIARRLLLVLVLVVLSDVTTSAQQVAVKPGRAWSLSEIRVHDPWILADTPSHRYYLYTASRSVADGRARGSVIAYKSTDLQNWTGPDTVFEVKDDGWADPADGLWAPEVHSYKGRYYLFATLHNHAKLIRGDSDYSETSIEVKYRGLGPHSRGTQVFVGDSPMGPFVPMVDRPAPPTNFMTLDGTLYVEDGKPYMVYAHEWIQLVDGAIEAAPLTEDLSTQAGDPFFLFKASDAPWVARNSQVRNVPTNYVTDGPELYKTRSGRLVMIWSSFRDGKYVETQAHSVSGRLNGPWVQDGVLVGDDSGHGMIFHSFDGRLMLVVHHPNDGRLARPNLYELEEYKGGLRLKTEKM